LKAASIFFTISGSIEVAAFCFRNTKWRFQR